MKGARSSRRARAALLHGVFCLIAGCRELPPSLTREYLEAPAASGWPPLAVYHLDPLHPRNRWFHRAFSSRAPGGAIERAAADEPLSGLAAMTAVDRAELAALLESSIAAGTAPDTGAAADPAALVFASDALAEAARLQALAPALDPDGELCQLLLRAAAVPGGAAGELSPRAVPPPLRAGSWEEVGTVAPGLLPRAADLRWMRVWRERASPGAAPRVVVARSRIALGADGEPVLLDLASECREAGGAPGSGPARLFRFDRAAWLLGDDPWREVAPGTGGPLPAAVLAAGEPAPPAGEARARQLEAARQVIAALRRSAAPASGDGDGSTPAR